jgi:outer membrane protein TolC
MTRSPSLLPALPALLLASIVLGGASLAWGQAAQVIPTDETSTSTEAADLDEDFSATGEMLVVPKDEPGGDLAPGASIVAKGRPLSIDQAIALSIRNNLNVEVERYEPLISETRSDGAWGAYDPTLSADYTYDVVKADNAFPLSQSPQAVDRERRGGVGVDQLIPYLGATLGLRFDGSKATTNSTFLPYDPQYDSSFFITANVPLARNLIWNESWTNVKVSAIDYRVSRDGFRTALMDNVQDTVDSYWRLVAARDQVRVAQKSLETARALKEQTETQYEVGVVSKVDIVEAEAGVANREFDLIRAANDFRNEQDSLIATVLGRELSARTSLQFVPTEDPTSYKARSVDVERAVQEAYRKRPELMIADLEIDRGEIDLKFAKNQRLPQLDAELRYGFVGLSGDGNTGRTDQMGNPVPPLADRGGYGDSTENFFTGDGNDNFRIGARFSIPIPNTTARQRVTRSQLELRRSKTRRVRLEQDIILEVRRAARLLLASQQGIEAAERRRLAAAEQLRAERIRLEHGESTPFDVLQRESDLVDAESQKIGALQAYRSAEVGLERAQGTILDVHDVVVDDVQEPTF